MATSSEKIRGYIQEYRNSLLNKANVVGVGVGYKFVNNKKTDTPSIVCLVEKKTELSKLHSSDRIPKEIHGTPTDVYVSGPIVAQKNIERIRPALGGCSIGHHKITAGTLGCLVKREGRIFILSNNHVLANSNDAQIGDYILQPGPYDGGSLQNDFIAKLSDYVPIYFEGENIDDDDNPCPIGKTIASLLNGIARIFGSRTQLKSTRPQLKLNYVDAALAAPMSDNDVSSNIIVSGKIKGIEEATLGMSIKKTGRTTGFTKGEINQIEATVKVSYGANKIAVFADQLIAGPMSQGGDSGSAVLNEDNNLVGLLFAGSNTTTIINPIHYVLEAFQAEPYID